jgi:cephalosporin hydroxylase
MKREAARTLHSLSRRYQQGIDDLWYDVVVVENGSDPDQVLGEDYVRSFGKEFRYIDWADGATPSPAHALNRGLAATTGHAVAFMVDGAHVLTPRVLHYGMTGLRNYQPAVVVPQAWYVGPGQQGDAMRFGYDQAVEDALFEKVTWPEDGYRLFEIGHFQGDRDWFDGLWESNCIFVERELLLQSGGFDEGFAVAGGGYTNLEFYERMASTPGVQVVTMLGEGTFHQIHGGTTTNIADEGERRERVRSYAEQYREMQGKPFQGPEKPIQFVGAFHAESAKRSRARRMTGKAFEIDLALEGEDGPAKAPAVPIPDDLRDTFTNAYYRSLSWRKTEWLGEAVPNPPSDLHAYQQLLSEVEPDWVIDLTGNPSGRSYYLATICELLGQGKVLEVADEAAEGDEPLPGHSRLKRIVGYGEEPDTLAAVRKVVGKDPKALVIIGNRHSGERTQQLFEAYCPMVPVKSFIVIEFTTLNGFPINASHGHGPHEALRRIMNVHGEFVADAWREQPPTFNHAGLLRRKS